MDRRSFLSLAGAAVAAPAVAGRQPKEKVKLVSTFPRTGDIQWQTDQFVNAIQMAIVDFETDTPFAVQHLDWDEAHPRLGGWDERLVKANVEKALADKDVVAVIGPYHSGSARVSAPLLNMGGLVQLTPSASLPGLTRVSPTSDPDEPLCYRPAKKITLCRLCPNDASQGPLTAEFVADELKAKSIYVLDDKELYGLGVSLGFRRHCEALKLKVLAHDSIDPLSRDLSKLVTAIRAKGPDVVYFGGTARTGAIQLAKDALAGKLECPLVLPDGFYDPAFIDAVGADALDVLKVYVTKPGLDLSRSEGKAAEFVKRYREKYKRNATAHTLYAYEATAVVLEALRATGKKDREAVRAAVVGTKDFDKGLLGKWSFDANGDTTQQPLTVATVEKGKFRAVRVLGTK
jgi:branched-chain amino acid transport system substrate-binding protein